MGVGYECLWSSDVVSDDGSSVSVDIGIGVGVGVGVAGITDGGGGVITYVFGRTILCWFGTVTTPAPLWFATAIVNAIIFGSTINVR